MSIVYDYLKEAEVKENSTPGRRVSNASLMPEAVKIAKVASAVKSEEKKPAFLEIPSQKKKKWSLSIWVALAGLAAGMFLFFAAGYFFASEARHSSIKAAAGRFSFAGTFKRAKSYSARSLTLEGIVYDVASPFVVINGKILERGGTIDDYTVLEISRNEVKLKNLSTNQNKRLILNV